ncbi:MAG: hypothetical protein Q4F75_05150 [Pseudomonadota bacterium]|nr:hypothetical protein [Pseudomonadota bacterium]
MKQVDVMLKNAEKDYGNALNVFMLLKMGMLPASIEDFMSAYYLARKWCVWLQNPDLPDCPLKYKDVDYTPALDMMQNSAKELEEYLRENSALVCRVFCCFNKNILTLAAKESDDETVKAAKSYVAVLTQTADFFAAEGDPFFADKLKE